MPRLFSAGSSIIAKCVCHASALKPPHKSQVMISTEGFEGVADVRSKRRQSDQAAPEAVWSCATWKSMMPLADKMPIAGETTRPLASMSHVRSLQPFIQCELRFLPLGRMRSAHLHFFGCQNARILFRSKLILIPGCGLRSWLVLR